MTSAIVPLSPGERPTERGWYVVTFPHPSPPVIVEADPDMDMVWYSGVSGTDPIREFTFIARIYPERIEGREG